MIFLPLKKVSIVIAIRFFVCLLLGEKRNTGVKQRKRAIYRKTGNKGAKPKNKKAVNEGLII
jgi:hypothetical protein